MRASTPPKIHAGDLGDLAAARAPDVQVRLDVQVVARGGFGPVLGAYDAYFLQYGEGLVDRAERHARVLALDDQVHVLGGRVSLRPG